MTAVTENKGSVRALADTSVMVQDSEDKRTERVNVFGVAEQIEKDIHRTVKNPQRTDADSGSKKKPLERCSSRPYDFRTSSRSSETRKISNTATRG